MTLPKGHGFSDVARLKMSLRRVEYYKTHTHWNQGRKWSPEVLEKLSLSHKGQRRIGWHHSQETIEKIRRIKTGLKQTQETIEKRIKVTMKALHNRPNHIESKLNLLLQQLFPSEYKYVGDGSVILAGKCPDFININGKKKIVELFGVYWHEKSEEEERRALFKQYGFDTLVVWENELENVDVLSNKLMEWNHN